MKRALVLSGGGVKGAYQAGAILKLAQMGLKFDIICGSSVGALNSTFLASYEKEDFLIAATDLVKFWSGLDQKDVYKSWLPLGRFSALWKTSLYNSEPLQELAKRIANQKAILSTGVELRVGAVSVETGKYKVFDQHSENLAKAIAASASFPPFFYPIKIEGELFYEAGLREYTPIKTAIEAGADEIYVVCTEARDLPPIDTKKIKTFGVLKRMIYTLASEVIINDFDKVIKMNEKVKNGIVLDKKVIDAYLVNPKAELVEDALDFNKKTIINLLEEGYNNAEELYK